MSRTDLRPAVAMIELIFAIVVIGIALMSAPMLISTALSSTTVALQQESINEAATKVNMIMTYEWDENNINVPCKGNPSILHTDSLSVVLEEMNNTTKKREGTSASTLGHTYNCNGLEYEATSKASLGQEDNKINDIDDFKGSSSLVRINTGTGGVDYIEQDTVTINTNIFYIDDNAKYNQSSFSFSPDFNTAGGTTNVKSIVVTLTSTSSSEELKKTITMRAFSSNVGSYHYYTAKIKAP